MTDLRACVLGDSYVLGQGDDAGLGWPGRVLNAARAEGAALTLYNLGIRAETGPQVAGRLSEVTPRIQAGDRHAVIAAFGANDISRGVPVAETVVAARQIIVWAKANGCDVFILSPPAMLRQPERDAKAAAITDGLAALCAESGTPFLNLREAVSDWSVWWDEAAAGDGSHPNGGGYSLISDAVSAWAPWRAWLGL
jgi:acyl-CoA thioesterase-1